LPGSTSGEHDLGSLAGGRRTIVVGAHAKGDDGAAYAATDAAGERGIDIVAAGRRDGVGFLTGASKQLQGTSVAAARVSGLLLAAGAAGSADAGLAEVLAAREYRTRHGRRAPGKYEPPRAPSRP
jgi:ABC-type amino acid transport substrate-binding protein